MMMSGEGGGGGDDDVGTCASMSLKHLRIISFFCLDELKQGSLNFMAYAIC